MKSKFEKYCEYIVEETELQEVDTRSFLIKLSNGMGDKDFKDSSNEEMFKVCYEFDIEEGQSVAIKYLKRCILEEIIQYRIQKILENR